MDYLSIVGTFSSLSGIKVSSLLRLKDLRKSPKLVTAPVLRLLSMLEQPDDPIVGHWAVLDWEQKDPLGNIVRPQAHISGHLSVLYKDNLKDSWRGIMSLVFNFSAGKTAGIFTRYWKQLTGSQFSGIYSVEFQRVGKIFTGTSSMQYRRPSIDRNFNGVWSNMHITDQGFLAGVFENAGPEKLNATVVFHQRRRWGEFVVMD